MTRNRRKTRILFVIHSLGFGGAERVVVDLVKNLDSAVYETAVCTFYDAAGFKPELDEAGVVVHVLGKKRRLDAALALRLVRLMRTLKPDVVSMHCRDAFHFGTTAALLCRIPNRIATEHSVGKGGSPFLNKLGFRLFWPRWNAVVAVSQFLKDFMVETWGIPEARIEVIYNGIDSRRLATKADSPGLRQDLGLPLECLVVGSVGTFKIEKGHDAFLKVAAQVASNNDLAHFVLIGDGPLMERLRSLAHALGLSERVHFAGMRAESARLAAGFDVFLCTSQVETFGLAAVEAMYTGVPVVSFDIGSMREIVTDGQDGYLVPTGETAAAAERVLSLLKDSSLRRRMGEAARESAKNRFSMETMLAHYERLFSPGRA